MNIAKHSIAETNKSHIHEDGEHALSTSMIDENSRAL